MSGPPPATDPDRVRAKPPADTPLGVQLFGAGLALLLVGGFVLMMVRTCSSGQDVHDRGIAFLKTLRAGKTREAYALLSAERRAAMTFEEFAAFTSHRALREHGRVRLTRIESRSGGRCTRGALDVGGKQWSVQLYYLEEGGSWHVHSLALQPPTPLPLGQLLPECGYWAGTRQGYHGPEIERSTQPTR